MNDARKGQDELLNTTSQRTEELNQLTQAQNVLMLRLQEEIETKEDVTNKLRNAEEEMEAHVANIERLENLLTEKGVESNEDMTNKLRNAEEAITVQIAKVERLEKLLKERENERLQSDEKLLQGKNVGTQREIEKLLKEKDDLQNKVENLKSKGEEMEKVYEKEKQTLFDKITELEHRVKDSESELRLHLSEDSHSALSLAKEEGLPDEKPPTPQTEDLNAKIDSLEDRVKCKEEENKQLQEEHEKLSNNLVKLKEGYDKEIERLRATKHEVHGNEELFTENESLKKEVGSLKMSVKRLTSDLQDVSKQKDSIQSTFQEAEIAWEDEKNNLQQQLFDSCLEASSFKVSEITSYELSVFLSNLDLPVMCSLYITA